jgi:hypothetical protein
MQQARFRQNSNRHQARGGTKPTFPPALVLVLVLTRGGEVGADVHGEGRGGGGREGGGWWWLLMLLVLVLKLLLLLQVRFP